MDKKYILSCLRDIENLTKNNLEFQNQNIIYQRAMDCICSIELGFDYLEKMDIDDRIDEINDLRKQINQYSPFKNNPVDLITWVKNEDVHANDYNPNSVAPPEMELLRHSIAEDGYTQPIVTWPSDKQDGKLEVIDGFHRNRVGKECPEITKRVFGYLPVVKINDSQQGKNDRIASTIRHNRARGKHKVEAMSDIVIELKRRNWSDQKIAKNLGMDEDEVLRLCQITGMAELFTDADFSKSWDIGFDSDIEEDDFNEEFLQD